MMLGIIWCPFDPRWMTLTINRAHLRLFVFVTGNSCNCVAWSCQTLHSTTKPRPTGKNNRNLRGLLHHWVPIVELLCHIVSVSRTSFLATAWAALSRTYTYTVNTKLPFFSTRSYFDHFKRSKITPYTGQAVSASYWQLMGSDHLFTISTGYKHIGQVQAV